MRKIYPWRTKGLQKYSERLKGFMHVRCTCSPPFDDDDIFEVPEDVVTDPIKRNFRKYKLSFADDFPYTRFRDHDSRTELDPCVCNCNICAICDCNKKLKRFPHYLLYREELPDWIQKVRPLTFRKAKAELEADTVSIKTITSEKEKERKKKRITTEETENPEEGKQPDESKAQEETELTPS
ncbi:uncharacterized protein LOC123684203 isoform X1 [Harmonia axyridis]|uniref:uncharacterized protein LOC123684203 isoform X1 n=1 Tax=Harmonia axyridis TaxID=115357 RepID=UPI001E275934|nr:uncharacterized protein LOC123684203 isoform X1 [Harmonia axyridis]